MIGPKVTIEKSCYGCDCERSVGYAVQGDSGSRVYCTHPSIGERLVDSDNWATPDWCPVEAASATEYAALNDQQAARIAELEADVKDVRYTNISLVEQYNTLRQQLATLRNALKEAEEKQGFCFACGEAIGDSQPASVAEVKP